jgi:hypothetical protein
MLINPITHEYNKNRPKYLILNSQKFNHEIEHFLVFGFPFARNILKAGTKHENYVPEDMKRSENLDFLYWVKGRGVVSTEGETNDNHKKFLEDRVAGTLSLELDDLPKGKVTFEYTEDTEVWCLDLIQCRFKAPQVQKFVLKAGEKTVVAKDTKLFVCIGDLLIDGQTYSGPQKFQLDSTDKEFQAITDVYGLIFL